MLNNLEHKLANILFRRGSVFMRFPGETVFRNLGEVRDAKYGLTPIQTSKSTGGAEHFLGADLEVSFTMMQNTDTEIGASRSMVQNIVDVLFSPNTSKDATVTEGSAAALSDNGLLLYGCDASLGGKISFDGTADGGLEVTIMASITRDFIEQI